MEQLPETPKGEMDMRYARMIALMLLLGCACSGAFAKTATGLYSWDPHLTAALCAVRFLPCALGSADAKLLSAQDVAQYVRSSAYIVDLKGAKARDLALQKAYQKKLAAFAATFVHANGGVKYLDRDALSFSDYNGRVCLSVSGIADTNVYNTLKLNMRQRIAKVLDSYLPALASSFSDTLQVPKDIRYFSAAIAFGAKDFSDESAIGTAAEVVIVLAAPDQWAKLANCKITDQQFVKVAEIYGCSGGKTRRIEINLSE